MRNFCWAAVLCLACDAESACSEPETAIVCAATPGGDGGAQGSVLVLAGAIEGDVEQVVVARPGAGGSAGVHELGPASHDGAGAVAERAVEVVSAASMFDRSLVDADARIDVGGDANAIAIDDGLDPPTIAVAELRIRSGATLTLSCDVRIVAERIVIERDATLALRVRNDDACVVGIGAPEVDPGQRGAIAFLDAATVVLEGTIDLAGTDGAPSSAGGSGGALTIRTEQLELGDAAAIVVSGGTGGDGDDEASC